MENKNGRFSQEVERLSIFELSGKLFGINILTSREVIPLPRFTPIPNSGNIYYGVFNLRGDIFPLIDISPILELSPKKIQSDDMVILLDNHDGMVMGVMVDKIYNILSCSPGDLKFAKGLVPRPMEAYLQGVLYDNDNLIHVLDLETLFRTKQILAHF